MSVTDAITRLRNAGYEREAALAQLGTALREARPEMGRDEYAALIARVRVDANLTASELASAIGVTRARLYQLWQ